VTISSHSQRNRFSRKGSQTRQRENGGNQADDKVQRETDGEKTEDCRAISQGLRPKKKTRRNYGKTNSRPLHGPGQTRKRSKRRFGKSSGTSPGENKEREVASPWHALKTSRSLTGNTAGGRNWGGQHLCRGGGENWEKRGGKNWQEGSQGRGFAFTQGQDSAVLSKRGQKQAAAPNCKSHYEEETHFQAPGEKNPAQNPAQKKKENRSETNKNTAETPKKGPHM